MHVDFKLLFDMALTLMSFLIIFYHSLQVEVFCGHVVNVILVMLSEELFCIALARSISSSS